jgi:hypothetical protein
VSYVLASALALLVPETGQMPLQDVLE